MECTFDELWAELEDVIVDENECIVSNWRGFEAGTHREDIWHWLEEKFGVSIGEIMNS